MIDKLLKKPRLFALIIGGANLNMGLLLIVSLVVALKDEHINCGFAAAAFFMVLVCALFSVLTLLALAELKDKSDVSEQLAQSNQRRINAIKRHIAG